MAYTLTQARAVLTAAELELFDYSRTQPIKSLTAARLRGKISRTRSLRDKYRDLYRRQAVAARAAKIGRGAVRGDNERTQRKAEIMDEVLGRFEERLRTLEAREDRPSSHARGSGKAAVAKTAARRKAAPVKLKQAVKRALEIKQARRNPVRGAELRSPKAPADHTPTSEAIARAPRAKAPLDVPAGAERKNLLKQQPHNIVLHAHSGSQNRRAQGQRDKR
jgi:hypothetical protein